MVKIGEKHGKCAICGKDQIVEKVGLLKGKDTTPTPIPYYNIDLLTIYNGKLICQNCMDTYCKIDALRKQITFTQRGKKYYADGRDLY